MSTDTGEPGAGGPFGVAASSAASGLPALAQPGEGGLTAVPPGTSATARGVSGPLASLLPRPAAVTPGPAMASAGAPAPEGPRPTHAAAPDAGAAVPVPDLGLAPAPDPEQVGEASVLTSGAGDGTLRPAGPSAGLSPTGADASDPEGASPGPASPDPSDHAPSDPASGPRRARGPQQPVPETAYLTAPSVGHYRPLMRFFYRQHQAQRFFIGVDPALQHIRQAFDAAYTEEQCQQDLQQLVVWGNLTRHFERTRVRTIDEFLRRQAVYQITPEGIAVERFVESLDADGRRAGSLDKTVLDALLQRMRDLDALLSDPEVLAAPGGGGGTALPAAQGHASLQRQERISSLWGEVRHHFERVANDGVGYLGELRGVQAQQILEHSAFQAYKDVLVRYLSSYALALAECGPRIGDIARAWAGGARGRLLSFCAGSVAARQPLPDGRYPDPAAEIARVHVGVLDLARWFDPVRGDVERLKRSTNDAIELVTRQAARLAELHWGTRSRRRDLEELALLFSHCTDVAQAERVASVAFAAAYPRHWQGEAVPEGLGRTSPWSEPAGVVDLRPVRRGARAEGAEEAVPERRTARDALLQEGLRTRADAERSMRELFPEGRLELGHVELPTPEMRNRLLELVGRCLASPDAAGEAPDGGRLAVVQRLPGFGRIVAPDGVCHVPRLVLVWEPGRDWAAAAAAAEGRGA